MQMPEPDQQIIVRRESICVALGKLLPADSVVASEEGRRAYDADGLSAYRQLPLAVVLPETVEQLAAVMKFCHAEGIKVVPRGAGTSLSGGPCRWPTRCWWGWENSTAFWILITLIDVLWPSRA